MADKVFFRTAGHPAYQWLEQTRQTGCVLRPAVHALPWKEGGDIYEFIASALLKEAELSSSVTYALPGSPVLLEDTTRILRQRGKAAGVEVRLVHGLSFVDEALGLLNLDFGEGLQVVLPRTHLETGRFTTEVALLVCQIEAKLAFIGEPRVDLTMNWLLRAFSPDHPGHADMDDRAAGLQNANASGEAEEPGRFLAPRVCCPASFLA